MTEDELQELFDEAKNCYENQEYEREVKLWKKISEIQPDNPLWKHNVAFALMNTGRLVEAFELFNFLAENHPELSRVHNNRALLLLRLGVDWQHLVRVLMEALVTSWDFEEFMRHFINLCCAAAFGFDEGANDALDEIERVSLAILKQDQQPSQFERNKKFLTEVLSAYRHIGLFRGALAARRWRVADKELDTAETKLKELGLGVFASGLEQVKHTSTLCRDVVAMVEELGADPSISPDSILEKFEVLLQGADSLAQKEKERHSALTRLLDVLGLFLAGSVEQLRFLVNPCGELTFRTVPHATISQLTAVSFIDLGQTLSSLLQFIDKQCVMLSRVVESIASDEIILAQRDEAWVRIGVFCNALAFDFRAIDVALAREALGWSHSPLEETRRDLQHFRSFIERQAYKDIFVAGKPQENIARSLLQAFLNPRSYREVPVRGGKTDLLSFTRNGRFLYETKIWRGPEYHEQGLRELQEYLVGEGDDGGLIGVFYIVFDPTASHQAESYVGSVLATTIAGGRSVDVVVISLVPPVPSQKTVT